MSSQTWAVVATVHEPPQLLAAFVAHYFAVGASEVHLYFDRPNPEAEALVRHFPHCHVVHTDAAYFRSNFGSKRPANIYRRQRFNANHAYRACRADWLLHVDADEFIDPKGLTDELASLPDEVDSLQVPNAERVFLANSPPSGIFEGVLRMLFAGPRHKVAASLGEDMARFTNRGFCGHIWGKSLTRTGRKLRLGVHAPQRRSNAVVRRSERAMLCHFDGMTPLHWVRKLERYAASGHYANAKADPTGRHRVNQLNFVLENGSQPAVLRGLHDRLRSLSDEDAKRLRGQGLIREISIDPASAVRAAYGPERVDLSVSAFDAALG